MTKVVFSTIMYYPNFSGVAQYTSDLASGLTKKGYDVTVYVPSQTGRNETDFVNNVLVKRYVCRELPRKYSISMKFLSDILKEKPDIVHSHHYGYFPAFAGFMLAKKRKVPHVFGPYYHPPIYGLKASIFAALYYMTQGFFALRFSDAVLPHTKTEKELLANTGVSEEKMKYLPNIVRTNEFKPSKGTNKSKKKTVLFLSYLMKEKGARVAFDIAKQILKERKDIRFVFIGEGPLKEQLISEAKGNKNFFFDSLLSKENLIKWYNEADVFWLPSKYEAFGRVIAEAMSCGTPIVSTNVGGIPEVVDHKKNGFLVEYGEWSKMKDYVLYLLDNENVRKKMGNSARKKIVDNFDKKIIVNKLVSIYEELLDNDGVMNGKKTN